MDSEDEWMGWRLKTGRKRAWKWVKRVVVVLTLVLLAAAGVLYFTVSAVPPGYAPRRLSQAQKKRAAQDFVEKAAPLHNAAAGRLLRWLASQDELNSYLASMDEIAAYRLGAKRGEVYRKLEKAKLSGLAVRLADGMVTLMFRSDKYGKVVSADISLEMTDDQKLRARLASVRVGRLRIPDAAFRERLARLKLSPAGGGKEGRGAESEAKSRATDDMVKILGAMVEAIDEAPTRIEHEMNNKLIRLVGVEVGREQLTLAFRSLPLRPAATAPTTGPG